MCGLICVSSSCRDDADTQRDHNLADLSPSKPSTRRAQQQQYIDESSTVLRTAKDERRAAIRLLSEVLGDVTCKRCIFTVRHRITVSLILRIGVLAYAKDAPSGAGPSRMCMADGIFPPAGAPLAWSEVKVAMHQLISMAKLWTVESVIRAQDVWPCMGDMTLRLCAIRDLTLAALVDLAGPQEVT